MPAAPVGIVHHSFAMVRAISSVWLAALSLAFSGCGRDLAQVHGLVLREGSAVSSGSVIFTPIHEGRAAVGPIQSDGSFQLTTSRLKDGAMIGQYRVSVAGDRGAKNQEARATFVGLPDLTFDVVAGKENEFTIDVRKKDGWQTIQGD